MKDNIEYQIFIGCKDSMLQSEVTGEHELREILTLYFEREQIDFSLVSVQGGFLQEDGRFITENTLCIDIIGASDLDIVRLAKNLSMLMNQECILIVKNPLQIDYR